MCKDIWYHSTQNTTIFTNLNIVFCFFVCVSRKLRHNNFDVIILENRPGATIMLSKKCNIPIINHIHTNLVNKSTPQKESIIQATEKFIVVSNYIKKEIESTGISTKIIVVYNGLDNKHFNKDNFFLFQEANLDSKILISLQFSRDALCQKKVSKNY